MLLTLNTPKSQIITWKFQGKFPNCKFLQGILMLCLVILEACWRGTQQIQLKWDKIMEESHVQFIWNIFHVEHMLRRKFKGLLPQQNSSSQILLSIISKDWWFSLNIVYCFVPSENQLQDDSCENAWKATLTGSYFPWFKIRFQGRDFKLE